MISGMLALLLGIGNAMAVDAPARKILRLGTVEFEAPANIKAFNIKGKATVLEGFAEFSAGKINKLEARIPIEQLTTAMSLRDKHMRERIFQTKDGKLPPLVLSAAGIRCVPRPPAQTCAVKGELEIQGIKKPFAMEVALSDDGGKKRAIGQGVVKLSDYGIPQPEQLGVKVANEVSLRIEVLAE